MSDTADLIDPADPTTAWSDYRQSRLAVIDEIPLSWFQVPYRSREEALHTVFGADWDITYLPVQADFLIPCFVLTHHTSRWRILTCLFESRWYPVENAVLGQPGCGNVRPKPRGQTRSLRVTLREMVSASVGGKDLAQLVRNFANRAESYGNPQAAFYVPALVNAWLAEQNLDADEHVAVQMLASLGGYRHTIEMMSENAPAL